MKQIIVLLFLTLSLNSFSQKVGDSKIQVKVSDTSNLYHRVKLSLIKNGFTVKDDENKTVLTTNVSVKKHLGYTIIKAEIKNDTVTVKGFYSNKKFDLKGDIIEPGRFSNIVYFKGSLGWPLLYSIASDIDVQNLSFSK